MKNQNTPVLVRLADGNYVNPRHVTVAGPGDPAGPALVLTCDDGELAPAVVRLTREEALAFADFLKRSTWYTFARATDQLLCTLPAPDPDRALALELKRLDAMQETWTLIEAAKKIRRCFSEAGFDP